MIRNKWTPVLVVAFCASLCGCRIMVAGDSFSSSNPSQFSWRYHLVDHFNDSLPNCQNASGAGILECFDMVGPDSGPVGGQGGNGWDMAHNSSSAATFFTQNQTIQAHVSTYQPHVLVVHLGVYDLFFGNRTATQTFNMTKTFIDNARVGGSVRFGSCL